MEVPIAAIGQCAAGPDMAVTHGVGHRSAGRSRWRMVHLHPVGPDAGTVVRGVRPDELGRVIARRHAARNVDAGHRPGAYQIDLQARCLNVFGPVRRAVAVGNLQHYLVLRCVRRAGRRHNVKRLPIPQGCLIPIGDCMPQGTADFRIAAIQQQYSCLGSARVIRIRYVPELHLDGRSRSAVRREHTSREPSNLFNIHAGRRFTRKHRGRRRKHYH